MKPLFPNKDHPETKPEKDANGRNSYKINADCQYYRPQKESTGSQVIDGDYYKVPNDAGKLVVWVANDQTISDNLKYFCHGYSFGTYKKFGYSLAQIDATLLDEWEFIGKNIKVNREGQSVSYTLEQTVFQALREALAHGHRVVAVCMAEPTYWDHLNATLAAWWPTSSDVRTIHSFKIKRLPDELSQFSKTTVSSKNTFGHFVKNDTINNQMAQYPTIAYLRLLKSKEKWKK